VTSLRAEAGARGPSAAEAADALGEEIASALRRAAVTRP
jgi:hypothetical protein